MTKDTSKETRNVSAQTGRKFFAWMRDQLYNIIYQEGDFALQMVGDLIRGYEPSRDIKHLTRQIKHHEKRVTASNHEQASPKEPKTKQKPLTHKEKQAFIKLLKRESGEGQIEYWKRKKWLLNLPADAIREMIVQREQLQKQAQADNIEVEANTIAHSYQQRLTDREERKRLKQRVAKRYRKRGR